jgi:predicted nucleic acid-binding protein
LRSDAERALWWGTVVECLSALHRQRREGRLSLALVEQGTRRLAGLIDDSDVIDPTSLLRDRAGRLVVTYPLRAADALQLAAALAWCDGVSDGESFVSLDERLREAARREGFAILP